MEGVAPLGAEGEQGLQLILGQAAAGDGAAAGVQYLGPGGADPVVRREAVEHLSRDAAPATPGGDGKFDAMALDGADGLHVVLGYPGLLKGAQRAVDI